MKCRDEPTSSSVYPLCQGMLWHDRDAYGLRSFGSRNRWPRSCDGKGWFTGAPRSWAKARQTHHLHREEFLPWQGGICTADLGPPHLSISLSGVSALRTVKRLVSSEGSTKLWILESLLPFSELWIPSRKHLGPRRKELGRHLFLEPRRGSGCLKQTYIIWWKLIKVSSGPWTSKWGSVKESNWDF